jgi:hypothetical protein
VTSVPGAQVEDRRGGAEGRSVYYDYPDEDAALDRLRQLMTAWEDWTELPADR